MRGFAVLLFGGLLFGTGAQADTAGVRPALTPQLHPTAPSLLIPVADSRRSDTLGGVLLDDTELPDVTPQKRGFLFSFNRSRLTFLLRPGYTEGLPIPEEVARPDAELAFQPNGRIELGAGSLSWLHVEVESFRVATGARRYRFIALPGIVLRPFAGVPLQLGMSVFFAYKKTPDAYSDERRRAIGFLQLSGRI